MSDPIRHKAPKKPRHVRPGAYYAFDLDGNVFRLRSSGAGVPVPRGASDESFVEEMSKAEPGPAFADFREAFNGARIMFVLTERGHSERSMRAGFRAYLTSPSARVAGIDPARFMAAMRYYLDLTRTPVVPDGHTFEAYLDYYLGVCDFYPVSHPLVSGILSGGETDPTLLKNAAMRMILRSVSNLAARLPGVAGPSLEFCDGSPATDRELVDRFYGEGSGVHFSVVGPRRSAASRKSSARRSGAGKARRCKGSGR